jgi:hypothetical protein
MFNHHGYGPGWIIVAVIAIVPFWRICARLGYSPWLSLLILVPIANVVLLYFLAFANWPMHKGGTGPGTPPGPTS